MQKPQRGRVKSNINDKKNYYAVKEKESLAFKCWQKFRITFEMKLFLDYFT